MIDLTGKTILLTGASSGIGAATARVLGSAGATLIEVKTPDPAAIGAVLADTAFGHAWAAHLLLAAALVAVIVFGPRGEWAATAIASAALGPAQT